MQWVLRSENAPDLPENLAAWATELYVTRHLAAFLWRRGLHTKESMQSFLNPSLRQLAPLQAWPGLEDAAAIVAEALLAGEKLCVWGDYDVDGITSTAVILEFLAMHGFSCMHHIPNRLSDGYGLQSAAITRLHEQGVSVLLTVDSGITDYDAISHAKSLGMTVIITDHHLPGDTLPAADAIVNPRLAPCPCPSLAGVGVAFFLVAAINTYLADTGRKKADIRSLLDLVALGTLADVVDLQGQNRILVKNGLLLIANGTRVGIAALKAACNHAPTATLGAGQVVFSLAPRLNAAGRLGSSEAALQLLLTKNRTEATALADELSRMNAERREEEERILALAQLQAEEQIANGACGLVLYEEHWHPGIIGIVASRIVELYHRPTVVLCVQERYLKGSGRSVHSFDIHEAFVACSPILLGYGGHKMAAGVSLLPENLSAFRRQFSDLAGAALENLPAEPVCRLDGELDFAVASEFTFLKELELLQPFGTGNAEPTFSSPPVLVKNIRSRPGFMTLELQDESSGIVLQAKAWRQLANLPASLKGQYIRIAYTPRIDRYSGVASVELRLKDWKQGWS